MSPAPVVLRLQAGDRDSRGSKHSPVRERGPTAAANACPRFTALVNHLVKTLFVNLTEKSASYPTVCCVCNVEEVVTSLLALMEMEIDAGVGGGEHLVPCGLVASFVSA